MRGSKRSNAQACARSQYIRPSRGSVRTSGQPSGQRGMTKPSDLAISWMAESEPADASGLHRLALLQMRYGIKLARSGAGLLKQGFDGAKPMDGSAFALGSMDALRGMKAVLEGSRRALEESQMLALQNEQLRAVCREQARILSKQKALRAREEKIQAAIVACSRDAIFATDLEGTIVTWNAGAEALYGYCARDVIGRAVGILFPAEREAEIGRVLCRIRQGGEGAPWEMVRRRKNGPLIYLQASFSPLRDGEQRVIGAVVVIRDITRKKRRERSERRMVRSREQFLATVSHELRDPLAALLNAAKLLEANEDFELRKRARAIVERQVRQVARLVGDLSEVSHLSRETFQTRTRVIDLRNTVDAVLDSIRPRAISSGLELSVAVGSEPLMVEADHARLVQLQVNLLGNAVKFTPRGGHVKFSLQREGSMAVIRISDSGCGFARSMRRKIFEPFAQAENGKRYSNTGVGLGLSLVRAITLAHRGRVEARSAGVGKGSEFVVTLPLVSHVSQRPALASNVGSDGESLVSPSFSTERVMVGRKASD